MLTIAPTPEHGADRSKGRSRIADRGRIAITSPQCGVFQPSAPTSVRSCGRVGFQVGSVIGRIKESAITFRRPRICEGQLTIAAAHDAEVSADLRERVVSDYNG